MAAKDFQIIRYKKGGDKLELMLKPGKFHQFKTGAITKSKLLVSDEIFVDVSKGDTAGASKIKSITGCTSPSEAIDLILKNGDYSYTTKEKNELIEQKKKLIINDIFSNYINVATNGPASLVLLENSIKSAGVKIDPFEGVSKQVDAVVAGLSKQLTLKKSAVDYEIVASAALAGQLSTICRKIGEMTSEDYKGSDIILKGNIKGSEFEKFTGAIGNASGSERVDLKFPGLSSNTAESDSSKKGGKAKKKGKK